MSTDEQHNDIFSPAFVAASKAQAAALKAGAAEHGLRFDVYLVPSVAAWVLEEIERGRFRTPDEVVFVAMQVFMELDAYSDLRKELLRREIEKSIADPSPGIPAEEVFAKLKAKMQRSRPEPPRWQSVTGQS